MISLGSVACIRVGTVGELSIHHLKGKMIMKMKKYSGGNLKGRWLFTIKKDGVNATIDCPNRTVVSRNNKPLYNFEHIFDTFPYLTGVYEVFDSSWETSISLVKNRKEERTVLPEHLYQIGSYTTVDTRLVLGVYNNPTESTILSDLKAIVASGSEGLVLYGLDSDVIYKVKPSYTVDVRVTGIQLGTGKYHGMMGALLTNYGKVGTGFTDHERGNVSDSVIGQIIEVEIMGWTPGMKMRHPRFKRLRTDKNTENLEI